MKTIKRNKESKLNELEKWLASSLLGEVYEVLSPLEVKAHIKGKIYHQIEKLLEMENQKGPYINLEALYTHRKILNVSESKLDNQTKAQLIPIKGGFVIQIRKDLNSIDRRTVIAHEIGHTFLYDIDKDIPKMDYPKDSRSYWIREGYAREIARAILIPHQSIKSIIEKNKKPPSIKHLNELSKLYMVSNNLLRIRLINDLKSWDCLIFNSELKNGNCINVNPSYTSKGDTYQNYNIPKTLNPKSLNKHHYELYHFLISAFNQKYKNEKINFYQSKFNIESKRFFNKGYYLVSLISELNSHDDLRCENTLFSFS